MNRFVNLIQIVVMFAVIFIGAKFLEPNIQLFDQSAFLAKIFGIAFFPLILTGDAFITNAIYNLKQTASGARPQSPVKAFFEMLLIVAAQVIFLIAIWYLVSPLQNAGKLMPIATEETVEGQITAIYDSSIEIDSKVLALLYGVKIPKNCEQFLFDRLVRTNSTSVSCKKEKTGYTCSIEDESGASYDIAWIAYVEAKADLLALPYTNPPISIIKKQARQDVKKCPS